MPAGENHQVDCSGSVDSRDGAGAIERGYDALWTTRRRRVGVSVSDDEEHRVVRQRVSPEHPH